MHAGPQRRNRFFQNPDFLFRGLDLLLQRVVRDNHLYVAELPGAVRAP